MTRTVLEETLENYWKRYQSGGNTSLLWAIECGLFAVWGLRRWGKCLQKHWIMWEVGLWVTWKSGLWKTTQEVNKKRRLDWRWFGHGCHRQWPKMFLGMLRKCGDILGEGVDSYKDKLWKNAIWEESRSVCCVEHVLPLEGVPVNRCARRNSLEQYGFM